MPAASTEIHLTHWRSGSTQAERLAAAILRVEGYTAVEPQAPIGGPDGRADILCSRGGFRYLAAVYFPSNKQTFANIFAKFEHDLQGATQRKRNAFAFFTNQRLSITERITLRHKGLAFEIESELFDVERIAGVLDEPAGYGLRAAYLGLPMESSEQISFFARREHLAQASIQENTAELKRVAEMVARLELQGRVVAQTMRVIAGMDGQFDDPPLRLVDPLAVGDLSAEPGVQPITHILGPELILLTHRMVGFELPSRLIGRFRTEEISIGLSGKPSRQLPSPDTVVASVESLCSTWVAEIRRASDDRAKLQAIARFHQRFLAIHPFADGNGRTARALLLQQCIDTFGRADMSRLDRGSHYQTALEAADAGNLAFLTALIEKVVKA